MFQKPYFDHGMVIRMITWKSFIRRRDFRNARGIFNQCNRYFCTWKSNVLLHNFRTRHSEFVSLSSTLEIHSHTFILQETVVEYLKNDPILAATVKFTASELWKPWCWWYCYTCPLKFIIDVGNEKRTIQNCHQHITSTISVTNSDIAKITVKNHFILRPIQVETWWETKSGSSKFLTKFSAEFFLNFQNRAGSMRTLPASDTKFMALPKSG